VVFEHHDPIIRYSERLLGKTAQLMPVAERYLEPGMERIRDWVFDRQ
jgi:hypothetical protein